MDSGGVEILGGRLLVEYDLFFQGFSKLAIKEPDGRVVHDSCKIVGFYLVDQLFCVH